MRKRIQYHCQPSRLKDIEENNNKSLFSADLTCVLYLFLIPMIVFSKRGQNVSIMGLTNRIPQGTTLEPNCYQRLSVTFTRTWV